jgi:hypothetical protein
MPEPFTARRAAGTPGAPTVSRRRRLRPASALLWGAVAAAVLTAVSAPLRAPAAAVPVPVPARRRTIHLTSPALWWSVVALAVLLASIAWIELTEMRPSYDAFGWLVWGRQVLHWDLNTDGAPSWKPLTLMFTLPYALAGPNPQVWLWMITATAGALAGAVFAARIAFRLTGSSAGRRWPAFVAAGFAAAAVLGIDGYSQQVLIANSDPLIVTLFLAAIDSHLSGRPRLAFALLLLVALGRPEGWAFAGLYAICLVRARRCNVLIAVLAVAAIPLAWFLVPALTSHSWFISADLARGSANVLHRNKILGVLGRLRGLYEWPMQAAVLFAIVLALVRRERVWLTLAGVALLWILVEIALTFRGLPAPSRYLMEPAAVLVTLAGGAIGWTLAQSPGRGGALMRWVPPIAVALLVASLVPAARSRARVTHGELHVAHHAALEFRRLEEVISAGGGAKRIKSCGQPVTLVGYQSEVAWALDMNVGNVGFKPGKSIQEGIPIVVFKPHESGWQLRPFHLRPADSARCELMLDSKMGSSAT